VTAPLLGAGRRAGNIVTSTEEAGRVLPMTVQRDREVPVDGVSGGEGPRPGPPPGARHRFGGRGLLAGWAVSRMARGPEASSRRMVEAAREASAFVVTTGALGRGGTLAGSSTGCPCRAWNRRRSPGSWPGSSIPGGSGRRTVTASSGPPAGRCGRSCSLKADGVCGRPVLGGGLRGDGKGRPFDRRRRPGGGVLNDSLWLSMSAKGWTPT